MWGSPPGRPCAPRVLRVPIRDASSLVAALSLVVIAAAARSHRSADLGANHAYTGFSTDAQVTLTVRPRTAPA